MKIKCFWEKNDVVGGKHVCKSESGAPTLMILSRGFSTGEPEFALADIETGVVTMATFMPRKALADWLTENDYEPTGTCWIAGETAR